MKIIDLSITIDNECMTCGTPWHEKVKIEPLGKLEEVGRNTSRFVLGSHSATHMDAPYHFIENGYGIDKINLETCIGEVTCIDFRNKPAGSVISIEDLKEIKISERMLFVFGWYNNWKTKEYYNNFPYFSEDSIKYLISKGMLLFALDTPSPDNGSAINELDDSKNHKILLEKNVIIIEYLYNTDKIDFSKNHEIIALPLKIKGVDGSPARVILKEI